MGEDYKKTLLREEYTSRINKVQDYIETHIDQELTLENLAEIANFSPFHFHRIYGALTGESLFQFIQRFRLEKAAFYLTAHKKKTITEIALECGFSNQASFARAFKKYFKISASQWRSNNCCVNSNNGQADSNNCKTESNSSKVSCQDLLYNNPERKNFDWRTAVMKENFLNVEVKEMEDMPVAYVRHVGPYKGDSLLFDGLLNKLFKWAGPRGLIRFPESKVLAIYHDNPELTDEEKLRISVCITVPENTPVDGEIGKMTVPGGKYAIGHFILDVDQYQDAWNSMFADWLPESGYQPDDRPCFELCINDPNEHPENKHIIDIYIPVKPL